MFSDTLSSLAAAMVVFDSAAGIERVARFDEFQTMLVNQEHAQRMHPLPNLISGFTPNAKPILWLRMLALSQLCIGLLETQGHELGLEIQFIDIEQVLNVASDQAISDGGTKYYDALRSFRSALAPSAIH